MSDAYYGIMILDRGLISDQVYALTKNSIGDRTCEPGSQLVDSSLASATKSIDDMNS